MKDALSQARQREAIDEPGDPKHCIAILLYTEIADQPALAAGRCGLLRIARLSPE